MKIKPVILSGGSGTRLWPSSRSSLPKQFINFNDNQNLFYKTINRTKKLTNKHKILIVSNRQHGFLCRNETQKLNISAEYILEETGRNTAAAVFFSALISNPDDVLCIMPSDHWISDDNYFCNLVNSGIPEACKGKWVTFGIKPTEPATGYGYIKTENLNNKILDVEKFVEKPNKSKAIEYLNEKNYFWNSGIFLVTAKKCLDSFRKFQPELVKFANECWNNKVIHYNEKILLKKYLKKIPSISLDYAIMEFEKDISLLPFESNWSDLGNWGELSKYISNNQNKNNKNFLLNSKNTFIYSNDRVVAGIGLEDLMIIDDDDATLVVKKGFEEKVKDVLEKIKKTGHSSATEHTFENRPWGRFENILDSKICKVKKLTVNPGQYLSLQYHKKRSEHWVVVEGKANVNLEDKNIILKKGESIDIPLGAKHSLGNDTKENLIVIEVQLGTYFGEDDIIRISDPYNR